MHKDHKPKKRAIALMTVRDEEDYIEHNIRYHLGLGFDAIFIVDHCSQDETKNILNKFKHDPRVIVCQKTDTIFDHGKIINELLQAAIKSYEIDWIFLLDADEFLGIKTDVHSFIDFLERQNIFYATVEWVNALFSYCENATSPIDTNIFYVPWPERDWQHEGHFRKAIIKNHDNIEVVVGGHYFKIKNNQKFFDLCGGKPFLLPTKDAKLYHFEFRNNAYNLFKKWEKLAENEKDSSSDENAPWLERIRLIKEYTQKYENDTDTLGRLWFIENRTIWGTVIASGQKFIDNTLKTWNEKNVPDKEIQNENICLIRTGYLGDVIMTEPIGRHFKRKFKNVYLATEYTQIKSLLSDTYTDVIKYSGLQNCNIKFDRKIRLFYELSSNKLSYIEGLAESANVTLKDKVPTIKDDWQRMISEDYILIAPNTSNWISSVRNWGVDNFKRLKEKIEKNYKIKVIILEDRYTFTEMVSLIKYCKIMIGNDSAPGIIAQCLNKKSFIIFGATEPKYVLFNKNTIAIFNERAHFGCNHIRRQEEIECRSSFCMAEFSVDHVYKKILPALKALTTK